MPHTPQSIPTIPLAILGDTSSSTLGPVWNVSHIARGSVWVNLLDEACGHRILDNSRRLRFLFAKPKRPTNVCVRDGLEVNVGKAGLHVARADTVLLCRKFEGDVREERNLTENATDCQGIQSRTISGYWRGTMAQSPFKISRPLEWTDLGRVLHR